MMGAVAKASQGLLASCALVSPRGERLLFAQAHGDRSGEWFVVDLLPGSTEAWPPACPAAR